MRGVFFFTLILLLILTVSAAGAEEIKLDVDKAVSLALENNLGLKADRIDLEVKMRAKQTSWNEFLPSIDASTGMTRSETTQTGASAGTASTPWSMSAGIRASLPLSLSARNKITGAALELEAQEISLGDTRKQLVRDVKKAFYNLLLLTEKIKLTEQNIATAQKRYDQARTSYEYGLESELTLLGTKVTLENLKPDLEKELVDYEIAEMEFKQSLGFEPGIDIAAEGSIEPNIRTFDAGNLVEKHISDRFDIAALLKDLEVLENEKKQARADAYTPALTVSYTYTARLSDPFQSGSGALSDISSFGIALSYPLDALVPGSTDNVGIKDLDDSIKKTQMELEEARQLAEIEIESTVMRLDNSMKSLKALEQNVILAQKVYDLTDMEYNAGESKLSDVEDAYDELQGAMLKVLEEKYNYISGLFDLEYELNTELDI